MRVESATSDKPEPSAPSRWGAVVVGALVAVVAFLVVLLWFAGQLSGLITGHGWASSSPEQLGSIVRTLPRSLADPGAAWAAAGAVIGPAWLVYLLFLAMVLPLAFLAFRIVRFSLNWRRRRTFRLLRLGFASGNEIRDMLGADAVIKKAGSVRPSLKGRSDIDPAQVGFFLGRDIRSRQKLYGSVEDVMIVLAPPRQGKDVHFCAPFTIDAPGACIVTSTRADAFTNTYAMRAKLGKVWVFDPNDMTNWPQRFRWSPIRGAEHPRIAGDRAGAFVQGSGFSLGGQGAYFASTAITVLRCYLHAAALGGMSMSDVIRWSTQPTNPEPIDLLRQGERAGAAAKGWGSELEAAGNTHPDLRGAVWATVVQCLGSFSDPGVLAACTPSPDEVFDMKEFLSGQNTLYILGKEKKNGSVSAIVTAMLEDMFDQIRKIASRKPNSRLDPPLTVELNEAAHIAPLPSLPAYMGDSGGFSIALHVYLQSLSQARSRWGDHEAMIMWDNAAIRVIMGGAGNVEDLEDISRLMGDVVSPSRSTTRDEGRRVLSPEEIRTLKFGRAVVVARAARPVEVQLIPWWERKDGSAIAAGKSDTEKRIIEYTAEAELNDKFASYTPPRPDRPVLDPSTLNFKPIAVNPRKPETPPAARTDKQSGPPPHKPPRPRR